VQFCSVTVQRGAYEGNIVFNINVSKYNTRFKAGDVPEVISPEKFTVRCRKLQWHPEDFRRVTGTLLNVT